MFNIALCTVSEVRTLTGLTTQDISDANLTSLIALATKCLNHDISVKVIREFVTYIDQTRTNYKNTSNTTFYIQNWKDYYIGDMDDDGDVDTSDITVVQRNTDSTESTLTVSSITPNSGKFVLSSAPSVTNVWVTYVYTPVSVSDPHPLVNLAAQYKTAALAFTRLDARKIQNFGISKLRITKQPEAFYIYDKKYYETINQIRRFPLVRKDGKSVTELVQPSFDLTK